MYQNKEIHHNVEKKCASPHLLPKGCWRKCWATNLYCYYSVARRRLPSGPMKISLLWQLIGICCWRSRYKSRRLDVFWLKKASQVSSCGSSLCCCRRCLRVINLNFIPNWLVSNTHRAGLFVRFDSRSRTNLNEKVFCVAKCQTTLDALRWNKSKREDLFREWCIIFDRGPTMCQDANMDFKWPTDKKASLKYGNIYDLKIN